MLRGGAFAPPHPTPDSQSRVGSRPSQSSPRAAPLNATSPPSTLRRYTTSRPLRAPGQSPIAALSAPRTVNTRQCSVRQKQAGHDRGLVGNRRRLRQATVLAVAVLWRTTRGVNLVLGGLRAPQKPPSAPAGPPGSRDSALAPCGPPAAPQGQWGNRARNTTSPIYLVSTPAAQALDSGASRIPGVRGRVSKRKDRLIRYSLLTATEYVLYRGTEGKAPSPTDRGWRP